MQKAFQLQPPGPPLGAPLPDPRYRLNAQKTYTNKQKNNANLPLPVDVQMQKAFQLQGGFAPLTPTGGSAPWTLAVCLSVGHPLVCNHVRIKV